MAMLIKESPREGEELPDFQSYWALRKWFDNKRREWRVTIAVRAALRVLPLASGADDRVVLPMFRTTAIARFAAKYPNRRISAAAYSAAHASDSYIISARIPKGVASAAAACARAAVAAAAATDTTDTAEAKAAAEAAARAVSASISAISGSAFSSALPACHDEIRYDAQQLYDAEIVPEQLAAAALWSTLLPPSIGGGWQRLSRELRSRGDHWTIWIDWYDDVVAGSLHTITTEAEDAAFTDIPGRLPWDDGAKAVNTEIARRLAELRSSELFEIPDQSQAPVRVEERDGRVSKATDRDSALSATERDFSAWRDPVVDHIDELTTSDFSAGTNHSRVRDRLMALSKLLPGEIVEVKDRQFRIGYEIERFEGLMAAYRLGGEDMPALNAAQLEDLDRLRVTLKMGIDKLERWSEFRKQANESAAGEADADREIVGDTLDEMAAVMEQNAKYFDPELPATFRFLSEAVRDPRGATKTVVYGAIKSAENLVSFLGQRALGIGRKGAEAIETHISKGVAASLIAGLSGAALELSGAVSQGWAWLKPLLVALGVAG
jgi:hypothetical protein